jgi:phosphate transport system substrate-binding protein
MVTKIDSTVYSIGYVDLADALGKDLVFAKIKNAAGQYVAPSAASANIFLQQQTVPANGQTNIDFTKKVKNAYQISILVYGVASTTVDKEVVDGMRSFFTSVLAAKAPAGYVALSGKAKTAAANQIKKIVK